MALLGSYVPRQCGIATFTKDIHDALNRSMPVACPVQVLAMEDRPEGYDYPPEVRFQIQSHLRSDYANAAELLNINRVNLLYIQHEYGIFGGPDGSHLLDLTGRVRMPIVTTLHTVLSEPSAGQARVMLELAKRSDRLVVMSELAARTLNRVYEVPMERIAVIPHGIPDVPLADPAFYKDQFGLEGREVLLTFGLLSAGKGIEYAIRAMPAILDQNPNAIYVVLGATHPHTLLHEGDAYRESLERLAVDLGVRDAVIFHNRFVSLDELVQYISAADIYVTPYLNKAQIVSGTLAYAAGAGKAIVSTPYWYAEELLADDRGVLIPFKDSDALAKQVIRLLEDDTVRNAMRKKAYLHCRGMVWKEVGKRYLDVAESVLADRIQHPRSVYFCRAMTSDFSALPDVNLNHLRNMTDATGIYQHANYSIPDRAHGYCTDDNARALRAVLMHYELYGDESVLPLANTYLSFMHHAFNPELGRFRNFMSFERTWLEASGGEDVHGRAINALGLAAALAPNAAIRAFAARLLHSALPALEPMQSLRPLAFAIIGFHAYLTKFPGDRTVRRLRDDMSRRLMQRFREVRSDDWPWCEELATYNNAALPHALILSGQWVPDQEMLAQGLCTLEWLSRVQTTAKGRISVIGNAGWLARDGQRAHFDQQPLEAMAMVEACTEAFRCTRDPIWLERARAFFGWFMGNNETQSVLYDHSTGGCRDGLHPDGPNLNQGAESTLAWLIAQISLHAFKRIESTTLAAVESNKISVKPLRVSQFLPPGHGKSQ